MATQEIGQELGSKLSVATFGWNKAAILQTVLAAQSDRHFLARFVGVATGIKPYKIKEGERAGEIDYGLQGIFEGHGPDGEVVNGSVLYLPKYVNDMVVSAFSAADDIASIRIGYDVYAQYQEKAATSYVFSVNDLLNEKPAGLEDVKAVVNALPMPTGSKVPSLEDKSKK